MHIVRCGMHPPPRRWLFSSTSPGTGRFTLLRRGWSLSISSPAPQSPAAKLLMGTAPQDERDRASPHPRVLGCIARRFGCSGENVRIGGAQEPREVLGRKGTARIATPEPLPWGQGWHHEFWDAKHPHPPCFNPPQGYRDGHFSGSQIHLLKENPKLSLDFAVM